MPLASILTFYDELSANEEYMDRRVFVKAFLREHGE